MNLSLAYYLATLVSLDPRNERVRRMKNFFYILLVIAFLTGKTFQMIDVSSCSHYHLERRYDFVTRRTVAGVSKEPGQKKKRRQENGERLLSIVRRRGFGRWISRRGTKKNINFDTDARSRRKIVPTLPSPPLPSIVTSGQ